MTALQIRFKLILCLLLISMLQPGVHALAADPDPPPRGGPMPEALQFDVVTLEKPGVLLMADSGDLDGDDNIDLLLFHKSSRETYEKSCSIYLRRAGAFSPAQPLEATLGESISIVAIRDIDSDGKDEICGFDMNGMLVIELEDGSTVESRRALEHRTLLPPATRQVTAATWIADINSDGRMDIALPVDSALHLFLQEENGGFAEARAFELTIRGSVSGQNGQNYVSYRLPILEFSDFDGDGRTDVGVFDYELMNFFLTGGSPSPNRHVVSPLIRKFTKDYIGATEFSDLNADGVPDAVIMLLSQKRNLQSEVRIYIGKKDLSYDDEPSNLYLGERNFILPMFIDVDGDGKKEMLLQNVDVGFGFFLNYFIRNRIRVDTELRKLGADGAYTDEPVIRRAFYIQANDIGAEPAHGIGDFDGDGLDDIVVGRAEDRLSFFMSNTETMVPKHPTFELEVPSQGNMKILNLNDDGRADIVIIHSPEDGPDTATVLLSR